MVLKCGGNGALSDNMEYEYYVMKDKKTGETYYELMLLKELENMILSLLPAIYFNMDYNGKRKPMIMFLKSDTNKRCGQCLKSENLIIIPMNKSFISDLKKSTSNDRFSQSMIVLTEIIWHEFWHWRGERGKKEIDNRLAGLIANDYYEELEKYTGGET